MTGDPWQEYVAAAQRLDAVRQGAAATSAEQDRALRAALDELAGVRARLAPQYARLRELGVPADQLVPTSAEVTMAGQATGHQPLSLLAALRQARATADDADAVIIGNRIPGGSPGWPRNLLVYGPFSAVVFIVQVALFLLADSALSVYTALCGLTMPAIAFGLGWLTVGLVFPPGPGGRPDRSPLVGAGVCFAPALAVCAVAGVVAAFQ